MGTYPQAQGSSPSPARDAASQAVLEGAPDAGPFDRHRERHSEITIGAGVACPQGRTLPVKDWTAQAFADALGGLTGDGCWWSPHLFNAGLSPRTASEEKRGLPELVKRPDSYRAECLCVASVALPLDLDYHDAGGKHVALPDALREKLKAASLPGNLYHDTPRGARVVALLNEPVTDPDAYNIALHSFAEQTRETLRAVGILATTGTKGEPVSGVDVDESCFDRARLLYTPNATIDGNKRSAPVVVMRERLYQLADFPPVEVTTPAEPKQETEARALPPVPWSALPGRLGEYGRAVSLNMEAPEPLVFAAMLTAISAAVPATARIEGRPGHYEIAPLWVAPVAQPGSKKTPVINRLLAPLEAHDAKLQAAFSKAQELHKAECAALLAQKTGKGKGSLPRVEQPPEPERAHVVMDDFTFEAAAEVLATNHRHGLGVVIAPDELMALFGGFNQYKKAGTDRQRALKLWAGQAIRINRQKRFIYAPSPRAALIGGIQPAVAVSLQALDESDGLLERLHFIDCREERAPVFDVPGVSLELEREYHARVGALLPDLTAEDLSPPKRDDDVPDDIEAQANAVTFTLNHDARAVYREFYLSCDRRGLRGWEAGYMGKIAGQCLRVALDLHHALHGRDVFSHGEVDGDTMTAAVAITQWFAAHTARTRSELSATRKHTPQVEAGLRWLRKQGGRAFLRDVQRANVAGVKSAEDAEALGAALVSAGVAVWGTHDTTAGNGRREIILTEGGA